MANSVYSIVLNDSVVEAIDRLAYENATNRSNMINQILAERVSYTTPEQRIKNILDYVGQALNSQDLFQILMNSGDNSLNIKSPFKYKYNPSVKYQVVLKRQERKGELRVTMRTQNADLLLELNNFLQVWSALERKYLAGKIPEELQYAISNGKYVRELYIQSDKYSEDIIARMITTYIQSFDKIMKNYFDNNDVKEAEKLYVAEFKKAGYVI